MKGDFSRDTFQAGKHFSRVLMQQGRVLMDADANEQTAILLHYIRTLARDLIGPYAAPVEDPGFYLGSNEKGQLIIGRGRYYVDGILVENHQACLYSGQPDYTPPEEDPLLGETANSSGRVYFVYLDVWERHVTSIEDDSIREKALNGPDTCTRAKVVWQVRALPLEEKTGSGAKVTDTGCKVPLGRLVSLSKSQLTARVDPGSRIENACATPPDSKYRGAENQLYRVEIHTGSESGAPTFKWSRDNGSVAAAWLGTSGNDLQVQSTRGFEAGNWVELTSDLPELQGRSGILVKLASVDADVLTVDASTVPGGTALAWSQSMLHPRVRRWDQKSNEQVTLNAGAVPVQEGTAAEPLWMDLEDGVQVAFSPGGEYRTGDYWLIPARVATGDIEWPREQTASGPRPLAVRPHGIEHHYAPLGFVAWQNGKMKAPKSCHCQFEPLSNCFSPGSMAVGAHLLMPSTDATTRTTGSTTSTRKRTNR